MSTQAQTKLGGSYVHGPARWRKLPRFGIKREHITGEYRDDDGKLHLRRNSGDAYERIRSYEVDPKAPHRKTDVSVAVSRLAAVAWCYPDDWSVAEILADMKGKDAHHSAPEVAADRGVEWDNREATVSMIDHGDHASITNTERRAYAEDAKRLATGETDDGDVCGRCGDGDVTLCKSEDWDGKRCVECSQIDSDGGEIEVLH